MQCSVCSVRIDYICYQSYMNEEQKILIKSFLAKNQLCVISTIDAEGFPNSAAMSFSESDDLEIIFFTLDDTKKFKNIQNNQKVAVTVGWSFEDFITAQYQGIASQVNINDSLEYVTRHLEKNPFSKNFINNPSEAMFIIKPTYIKYSNLKADPKEVFEVRF